MKEKLPNNKHEIVGLNFSTNINADETDEMKNQMNFDSARNSLYLHIEFFVKMKNAAKQCKRLVNRSLTA